MPLTPSSADLDRICEVLPYLFIGSYGGAEDARQLTVRKITHAICLIDQYPEAVAALEKLCIPMSDDGDSDLREVLAASIPFITRAREAGGRVLVFCAVGVNRSAALTAGYLQQELRCSTVEALARIRSARPFVRPHAKYLAQLEELAVGG